MALVLIIFLSLLILFFLGTRNIYIYTKDIDDEGAPRLEFLAAMASSLKETDPEEGAAIETLARKLAGREYFLDPRVFNYPQVCTYNSFVYLLPDYLFCSKPCKQGTVALKSGGNTRTTRPCSSTTRICDSTL